MKTIDYKDIINFQFTEINQPLTDPGSLVSDYQTSQVKPDPSWCYTDLEGHEHVWNVDFDCIDTSVEIIEDKNLVFYCKECDEQLNPTYLKDYNKINFDASLRYTGNISLEVNDTIIISNAPKNIPDETTITKIEMVVIKGEPTVLNITAMQAHPVF
jgi:hypothetical protein